MDKNPAAPTNLVLFGVTGDLVKRKIFPAIYDLYKEGRLPEQSNIIGFSRREMTDEELQKYVTTSLGVDDKEFLTKFSYVQGVFEEFEGYKDLHDKLMGVEEDAKVCFNSLFYLAVPPKYYPDIFKNLSDSGLSAPCSDEEGWARVIVEKPFGHDADTAKELENQLSSLFKEEQIYRIDHYLGKEVMQNILLFRFSNNLLEHSWDNTLVEKVEIKFLETLDVEERGSFYDAVGALRDVGQNHVLQMLALATMNDPLEMTAEKIRESRAGILRSLKVLSVDEVKKKTRRGQYAGYKETEGVAKDSKTETYFRIEASFDNNKWFEVPIILEGGKGFDRDQLEMIVTFKGRFKNKIVFSMSKENMGISLHLVIKKPGLDDELENRVFEMPICSDPMDCDFAPAYEKLLLECIEGDQTLFVSTEEVKAAWRFTDPIIDAWQSDAVPLEKYPFGASVDKFTQ